MPGLLKSAELRQKAGELHDDNTKILTKAAAEERDLTSEEQTEFEARQTEIDKVLAQAEAIEKHEAREAQFSQSRRIAPAEKPDAGPEKRVQKADRLTNRLIRNWLAMGTGGEVEVDSAGIEEMQRHGINPRGQMSLRFLDMAEQRVARARILAELRQQATTPGTAGGYLIPEGFSYELEKAMLMYTGMREVNSRIIRTASGNPLPWPTVNDTSNVGEILAENAPDSEQDVTYGQVTFNAFKFTSKIVRVSIELIQDSAFDMEAHLADLLGERIGRAHNQYFTTGTGTGQPQGVMTAAPTVPAAALGAIDWKDLVELEHGVDRAYRTGAEYMFSDNTVKALKLQVDGQQRPLWQPGITAGAPSTINGYTYVTNNDVADVGASAKSAAFGQFQKFGIRDVMDIWFRRLDELYAANHQVGFVAISRNDSRLIDAGTGPIKVLEHPAT